MVISTDSFFSRLIRSWVTLRNRRIRRTITASSRTLSQTFHYGRHNLIIVQSIIVLLPNSDRLFFECEFSSQINVFDLEEKTWIVLDSSALVLLWCSLESLLKSQIQGYSKWLSGFWQLVIHNTLEIAVCICTDGPRNSQSFLLWCAVCSSYAFLRLERSLLRWRRTAVRRRFVWNELDYRVDACRITKGAHIEHL